MNTTFALQCILTWWRSSDDIFYILQPVGLSDETKCYIKWTIRKVFSLLLSLKHKNSISTLLQRCLAHQFWCAIYPFIMFVSSPLSCYVLAQCPRSFLSSLYQAKTLIQVLTPSSHHSCAFLSVLGMDRIQLNCRLTVVFIEFVTYSFESWCTQRVQHSQDLTVSYREQSRASLCACIAL